MNILIAFHPINDWGGIINHTDQLVKGFEDLGHTAQTATFVWSDSTIKSKNSEVTSQDKLNTDFYVPYKGSSCMETAKQFLNKYDLIIWTIPVPTKSNKNEGNNEWPGLYKSDVQQVIVNHDGNLLTRTPWIHKIKKHINGVACVHPCAYGITANFGVNRALIFNPQDLSQKQPINFTKRKSGMFSAQTFKAWKHVHELVRAIRYLPDFYKIIMGGGGIEYHYMTSEDKCKDIYYDIVDGERRKIWDLALENGMSWMGYVTNEERIHISSRVKCVVDPAWSKSYAAYGDMFSRAFVDATIAGAIPVARNMNMGVNGDALLYKKNVNYFMVPCNATPITFANAIIKVNTLERSEYEKIANANFEILHHFERSKIAQEYIELADGRPTGYYKKNVIGIDNKADIAESNKTLKSFFKI